MNSANFHISDATARKIVLILFILYAAAYSTLSIFRHTGFNSSSSDLANVDQALWNTSHGRIFEYSIPPGSLGKNYLGSHLSFILFFFVPLYWIWENVIIILIAQSVLLGTGVFAIYRIARLELDDPRWGLLFSLLYVFYPPIGFINRFDFHPVAFAIPIFLFAWTFYCEGRLTATSICLGLALCCKESVGLTLFAVGLVMSIIHPKQRRFWLIWSLISLAASLTAYFYIIPFFNKGGLPDSAPRYAWLGKTPGEMVKQFITHPWESFSHQFGFGNGSTAREKIFGELRRVYPLKMFLPFLLLPFLGWPILLATLPAFGYNLLSGNINQSSIYFQYNSPIIPFLFIGTILGFKRVLRWSRNGSRKWFPGLIGWFLVISTLFSFFYLDNPFTKVVNRPYFQVFALQTVPGIEEFYQAARLIPTEASVQTSYAFAPHLSHRQKLYRVDLGKYFADYLILNVIDFRWHLRPRHVRKILSHPGYEIVYSKNNVVLLKKKTIGL
jgi:uncharacterized membrane protein